MNTRRIICTLMGIWIGGSLFMAAAAVFSFRLVNELILNPAPEMAPYFKLLGAEKLRMIARYQAAEFNRSLFEGWGLVQILLGLLIFGILLFGSKEGKLTLGISLSMVLLCTVMHLGVTPSIVGYGRTLDFVGPDKEPQLRSRVQAFHYAYSGLEGLKLLSAVVILGLMYRDGKRRINHDDRFDDREAA
ncbi:MAG: hypothetical protein FJW36_01820 [Acidobacteria bacterium]|nr:hypothetical protein [Acidobacteriota bacterium]